MILLQSPQGTDRCVCDTICQFVRQGQRLGILLFNDTTVQEIGEHLNSAQKTIRSENGQEISFDIEKTGDATLPALLGAALDERRRERPFRIDLPVFPDGPSKNHSPFIARAILWQRLCDRLIEDEEPSRPTVLVLEHFDFADAKMRHDLTRMIRFHQFHRVRRSFLLTMPRDRVDSLDSELLDFVEGRFEL